MGVQYLGPVSRHNLVCPLLLLWIRAPVWDHLCLATPVVVVSLVDMGPPRTSPVGSGRSGRESVMAVDRFCRNAVGPPEWECEAVGSVVWVQCANLYRVFIKSIDSHVLGYRHSS